MPVTYKEVGRITSASNPTKEYIIKADDAGRLSCSCPAWRFKNGKGSEGLRYCKHLREHWNKILK